MNKEQIDAWDKLIAANPDGGNVFQSAEFAETKRLNHWEPLMLEIDGVAVMILQKKVRFLGNFWYIPKGPGATDVDSLNKLVAPLKKEALKRRVFAVKVEPELLESAATHQELIKNGLKKSHHIQPNTYTVLLDISPPLDEVLKGLNQKGRHAINRARRDGVTARPAPFNQQNAKIMYDLLVETARGRFENSIRSFDYYYHFWEIFCSTGRGSLFFAYADGQVVSAAFAVYLGKKSTYKDGASVRDKQVYGASHLLQWEIISWMKERGCTVHDLCGSPPSGQINNPAHPSYGLGRFKTSFNKHVTDYIGAYDIVIKPLKYRLWTLIGERLAQRAYYQKHHQSWY